MPERAGKPSWASSQALSEQERKALRLQALRACACVHLQVYIF